MREEASTIETLIRPAVAAAYLKARGVAHA